MPFRDLSLVHRRLRQRPSAVLPGVDGRQLAERICRQHADVVVLFMSGYADPMAAPNGFDAPLLEKPFTAQTLRERVRKSVDGTVLTMRPI
jgi:FixJ family two-component response regulator